ncbi:serine/threonine-protein kinase [Actinocorallia populi]|uniref:serine/threonine-protein kinase n=1 Tax=Actinocorallia populi TaxID=2079200 RepID=UPI000D08AEE8|nr:serine/threonine-protein kinase [Actinocorallia populi]
MTSRPLHPADPTSIGPYTLLGVLGEGSQGAVYLGTLAGRRVAIKLMHERYAQDARARRRFVRELEAAKKVARFCTAQVLDADVQGRCPYIVSEYVPGPSLQELVLQDGPRTGGALERLAVSTLTALAAIHRAGFVHRDFKPANIIMGPDGPRVVDFGIARALDAGTSGGRVGTLPYMSPEQLNERTLTPASDLFSWASCLLFSATGTSPFAASEVGATVHRILHVRPDTSSLPQPLRDVVEACLDHDPAARPDAARAHALLLGEEVPPLPARAAAPATEPDPAPPTRRDRPRRPSANPAAAAVLATAAVVVLGTAAAWILPRTDPSHGNTNAAVNTPSTPPPAASAPPPNPTQSPTQSPTRSVSRAPAPTGPPRTGSPQPTDHKPEKEEQPEQDAPKNDVPPATEEPGPPPSTEPRPPANDPAPAAPAPAPAHTTPPYDAVHACNEQEGDGFHLQESRTFPGGTLHLLYSRTSRLNCVTVIKTADVGTYTPIWVEIARQSDGLIKAERGSYRYYATASILAPGVCVRIAGGGPHGRESTGWVRCG